jgi:hypothetical protein
VEIRVRCQGTKRKKRFVSVYHIRRTVSLARSSIFTTRRAVRQCNISAAPRQRQTVMWAICSSHGPLHVSLRHSRRSSSDLASPFILWHAVVSPPCRQRTAKYRASSAYHTCQPLFGIKLILHFVHATTLRTPIKQTNSNASRQVATYRDDFYEHHNHLLISGCCIAFVSEILAPDTIMAVPLERPSNDVDACTSSESHSLEQV